MSTPTALAYENRDYAYRVVSPLYDRLARLVPAAVTPNQLTMLGLGCAIANALVLNLWHGPATCLVGAALVLGYELFDSLDGKHARNTGQSSRFGAYLDTSIDGIAAGLLYVGLLGQFGLTSPVFLFALTIRMGKACIIYASAAETKLRITPEIGTTVENLTMAMLLVVSALWPHAGFNLGAALPQLQAPLAALQLDTIDPVRGALLFLVVFLPISAVFDILEVKRLLEQPEA